MGCCGGSSNTESAAHVYDDGDGNVTTYPTETQARAARIRNGGVGEVRPA